MKSSRQLALRLRAQRARRRRPLLLESLELRACPATFFVNTNADTFDLVPGDGQASDVSGNTSLRAAIMEANALPGADTINLPSGNFVLTLGGIREDAAATGDLDITDNLTITGVGSASTTINGNQLDRIFHVHRGASVEVPRVFNLSGVRLTGGVAAGTQGADFQNRGGAIFIDFFTDVTISSVHFIDNRAPTTGSNTVFGLGGAVAASGVLTIENSRFENNLASNSGGALYLSGNIGTSEANRNLIRALVRDSALVQNNSNGGGAITSHIPLTIERSEISGNTGRQGGGIEIQGSIFASLTLVNSTVSGNSGTFGGGITFFNTITVRSSTIAHNSASSSGGGIEGSADNAPTIQNSLIANNTAPTGPNIRGAINSLGNNLVRNPADASGFVASDILNVDPLLAALANNGGPTRTHALLAGSPAINAANTAAAPATDQRGVTRPQGLAADIGAFELQGNAPPVAEDQSFATDEDVPIIRVQLAATDVEGAALTFTRLTQAANGFVVITPGGLLTYIPNFNFHGTDTFTFRVSDGSLTDDATVTITVNPINDAPFFANPTLFTMAEDTTLSDNIDYLEVEGDPVVFSLLAGPPQGSITVNGDGTFVYTPALNFTGLESFSFRARDDQGAFRDGVVTITVTPVNDAPLANDDRYFVDEDQTLTLTALPITRLVMHSEAGDFVGQGNDYDFTLPTSTFNADRNFDEGVSISIDPPAPNLFWHLDFAAASPVPLEVGHYPNAQRFPFQDPGHPGLAVFGDGRGFNELVGEFTVRDVVYGAGDEIVSFAATFVQQGLDTGSPAPPMTGTIQFNSTIGARAGVLENDTDVDGDTLLSAALVAGPTNGTLTLNRDGTLSYTPNANFSGLDSFTYRTSDGQAESNIATVEIIVLPIDDAPVAVDDSPTTAEDTAVTIDVLANDIDADGDPLVPRLLTSPASGGVVQNADNTFTYTPLANFHGTDSFTYQVTDGQTPSNVATVTITVTPVNDAPVARDNSAATDEDTAVTLNVIANDSDVDGDALETILVTSPAHGSLVQNPGGSFTYTPAANYHGSDSFTYRATDGALESNLATVAITIRPVNDPPVARDDNASTSEDNHVIIDVLANDEDEDGDALSPLIVVGPAHGSLQLNADGTFTFTPASDYHGSDSFTYKVSDGQVESNTAVVNILVESVNDPPVAQDNLFATLEDTPLSVALPGVLDNDADIDGDVLEAILGDGPSHGTLALNSDGSLSYTPAANFHGTDSFTYRASDGADLSNLATVTIEVAPVNDTPVAVNNSYTATQDTPLVVSAPGVLGNDSDADGDPLSAGLVSGPAHGTVALQTNGSFTYTPAPGYVGPDSFSYQASDGTASSNVAVVSITVEAAQATLGKINANAGMDNGLRSFFMTVQAHENKHGIKYQGQFRFQDRQNGISLESTAIDHLRVELDGRRATFRGTATVNGVAGYTFVVTVVDRDHPGPGDDNFRVQIVGPGGFAYDSLLYALNGGALDKGNIHVRPR